MDTEKLGSVADVSLGALQGSRDEHFFELAPRVIVKDALVQEVLDQFFELIPHGYWSSRPVRSRKASTYFSRVRRMTSSGSEGTGGWLFQWISSR